MCCMILNQRPTSQEASGEGAPYLNLPMPPKNSSMQGESGILASSMNSRDDTQTSRSLPSYFLQDFCRILRRGSEHS